jgi:maltose O-acetyltransferase
MTEVEKMRSSQLADMSAPELQVRFEHAKKLLAIMRGLSTYDDGYRELLEELVPGIPETSVICPPFHCDHGDGIKLGEHVFVNANCTFLDGGYITIGAHTHISLLFYTVNLQHKFFLSDRLHLLPFIHKQT